MKVWITKYALTRGIFEAEVEERDRGMVRLVDHRPVGYGILFHAEGRDWHRTLESALARCEVMREAKLKSLEKSSAKLRKLDFAKMAKP